MKIPRSFLYPVRYATLIRQFTRRDIQGKYRGSWLGMAWSFVTPLLMLSVYCFVFLQVFKARWPTGRDGGLEFALQMYAGLIVFNLFAEVVSRAPRLILEQPNLVKKVVFPLEILPWVSLLSALFHLAINLFILLLATAWAHDGVPIAALSLPLVLLPILPLLLGLGWLLSALGVYVRDIGQVMAMAISALMFLSPVFYSARSIAPEWQSVLYANPLTLIIEQTRRVLLEGLWPDLTALGLYAAGASLVALLGAACFQHTRKGFADVL